MIAPTYLADTSVFARLSNPKVAALLTQPIGLGLIAVCAPVKFELGFSAQSPTDYETIQDQLAAFANIETNETDHISALKIQAKLAELSQHRAASLVDCLIAAAAMANNLTVLHYDSDFELIAKFMELKNEWVVPRGEIS